MPRLSCSGCFFDSRRDRCRRMQRERERERQGEREREREAETKSEEEVVSIYMQGGRCDSIRAPHLVGIAPHRPGNIRRTPTDCSKAAQVRSQLGQDHLGAFDRQCAEEWRHGRPWARARCLRREWLYLHRRFRSRPASTTNQISISYRSNLLIVIDSFFIGEA